MSADHSEAREPTKRIARDRELLKACYDMFKKLRDSHYVQSPFEITVFYDEADCDGTCLMDDIEAELDLEPYR